MDARLSGFLSVSVGLFLMLAAMLRPYLSAAAAVVLLVGLLGLRVHQLQKTSSPYRR